MLKTVGVDKNENKCNNKIVSFVRFPMNGRALEYCWFTTNLQLHVTTKNILLVRSLLTPRNRKKKSLTKFRNVNPVFLFLVSMLRPN